MKSSLVDAGLRQLVSFVLRRRVRSFRDLIDGAVFYGREWKRDSDVAPKADCTELTSVEFDDQDRLVITGRANLRAGIDAPVVDNSFKLRARVAAKHGGHAIKLTEPEIAIIIECPKQIEASINELRKKVKLPPMPKPKPIYSYIPIHNPFQKDDDDDTGGYYMGEDNILNSIYVKDNCLRFEMTSVLRPGRFLGSHYLAFTVPEKSLIITLERVKNGMRAARRRKKALAALKKSIAKESGRKAHQAEDALALDDITAIDEALEEEIAELEDDKENKPPGKSFISRFVDGYLQASPTEDNREKLAVAISDWFGRQGNSQTNSAAASASGKSLTTMEESKSSSKKIDAGLEQVALDMMTDDASSSKIIDGIPKNPQ